MSGFKILPDLVQILLKPHGKEETLPSLRKPNYSNKCDQNRKCSSSNEYFFVLY